MAMYEEEDVLDGAHEFMAERLEKSDNDKAFIAHYSDDTAIVYLSNKIDIDKLKYLLDTKQLDKVEK